MFSAILRSLLTYISFSSHIYKNKLWKNLLDLRLLLPFDRKHRLTAFDSRFWSSIRWNEKLDSERHLRIGRTPKTRQEIRIFRDSYNILHYILLSTSLLLCRSLLISCEILILFHRRYLRRMPYCFFQNFSSRLSLGLFRSCFFRFQTYLFHNSPSLFSTLDSSHVSRD